MSRTGFILLTVGLFTLAAAATVSPGQEAGDAADDGDAASNLVGAGEVGKLIAGLASADTAERLLADVRLKNLPGAALPAVEAAAKKADLPPAARAPVEAAQTILRARARKWKKDRDNWDANLRSAIEAYDRDGRHNPKWDAAVHDGITLVTKPDSFRTAGETDESAVAAFKKATDAGCTDAFVIYFASRAELKLKGRSRDPILRRFFDAVRALDATQYPADRKAFAAARFINESGVADQQAAGVLTRNLARAFAVDLPNRSHFHDLAGAAYEALALVRRNRQAGFDEVYAAYAKACPPDDPWPHVFNGNRQIKYAWEARGNGLADTVTDEGWRLFHERLNLADRELKRAWELDPTNAKAATAMISVELGLRGDRDEMEKWFGRALAADPDNFDACIVKLQFLLPRWHGSHEEMVAFGRECLAGQNWTGNLPYVLVRAHSDVAREMVEPQQYLAQPHVWDDIRSVHEGFLKAFPDAPRAAWHRNRLAKWACDCSQWDAAWEAFSRIGDNPDLTVFRSRALYNYYRRKAEKLSNRVKQVSAPPVTGEPLIAAARPSPS